MKGEDAARVAERLMMPPTVRWDKPAGVWFQ
jgi:hypothetical protein